MHTRALSRWEHLTPRVTTPKTSHSLQQPCGAQHNYTPDAKNTTQSFWMIFEEKIGLEDSVHPIPDPSRFGSILHLAPPRATSRDNSKDLAGTSLYPLSISITCSRKANVFPPDFLPVDYFQDKSSIGGWTGWGPTSTL